jgi:ribosomal protein L35
LKLTKTGKVKARTPGFNHFNAKQSRGKQLKGKVGQDFKISNKDKSYLLPFN